MNSATPRPQPLRRLLPLLLVAGLVLAGCAGAADSTQEAAFDDGAVEERGLAGGADAGSAPEAVGEPAAPGDGADIGLGEPPAPRAGDRIIKEGIITIELPAGGFDRGYQSTISTARRFGGDVLSSSSSVDDNGRTSGMVTVRVPVDRFEDLLVAVGGAGTVRGRDVSAQDVSAEFVDLEARLRHQQAQERFYLGLLEKAVSVNDAIAVQQQLDSVQERIEQIRGRLDWLRERTAFSTLTVELYESGAAGPSVDGLRPTLSRYWETARDAFVNVVGAMLVVTFFLAPPLLLVGLALGLWLALRRRRRGAAPTAQVPPPPAAPEPAERVGADR